MLDDERPHDARAARFGGDHDDDGTETPRPRSHQRRMTRTETIAGGSSGSSLSSLTPEPHSSRPPSQSPLPAGPSSSSIATTTSSSSIQAPPPTMSTTTITATHQISSQAQLSDDLQAAMPDGPDPGQWEEPCCMFVKDCNTGSQLRKAISHLFGRNKSCTLRIPKKIWVYYCRKHYQRVRYRNAKTYPLNQMELVKLQIRRLRTWSVENQRGGSGPFIKAWTLSLRKREKNRLNQHPGAGAGVEGPADDGGGSAGVGGDGQSAPAAPDWLLQRLGSGYTTEQMMDIADHLHQAIKDGTLSQVPEIEFLPDITDPDEEEAGAARPVLTRKQQTRPSIDSSSSSAAAGRPPKRKASHLWNIHAEIHPPSPYWRDQQMAHKMQEKRARMDRMAVPYRRDPFGLPATAGTATAPAAVGFDAQSNAPSQPLAVAARDHHHHLRAAAAAAAAPPPSQQHSPSLPSIQFFPQGQSLGQAHANRGMSTHDRVEPAPTEAYEHHHPIAPPGRPFGPGPTQPSWDWDSSHRSSGGGHVRLPSISAQLPSEPSHNTSLAGISSNNPAPPHPYHRGQETYPPVDQGRSHMAMLHQHQQRTTATLPPMTRLDHHNPHHQQQEQQQQQQQHPIGTSPRMAPESAYDYESTSLHGDPWQHQEQQQQQRFAPDSDGAYRRASAAANAHGYHSHYDHHQHQQPPQQQHAAPSQDYHYTGQGHPSFASTADPSPYSWTHQQRIGRPSIASAQGVEHAPYAGPGWPQDHFADSSSRRNMYPPPS